MSAAEAAAVLVACEGMDPQTRRLVSEACAQSNASPLYLDQDGAPPSKAAPPRLVISSLPAGQRFVPELAAKLATQAVASVPLLLLSAEPLVRYSVSLARGRLTLVGAPLTRDKVAGRIRTLLAGRGAQAAGDRPDLLVREYRGREWWAGVAVRGLALEPQDEGPPPPLVSRLGRGGFAAMLPLDLEEPPSHEDLERAAHRLDADKPERGDSSDRGLLAALRFDADRRRWSFHWPEDWAIECFLTSAVRFPSRWRIARSGADDEWNHLAAASGDVVLLCASGSRSEAAAIAAGMAEGMPPEGGGPGLLDRIERFVQQRELPSAVVVAELR